MTLNIFIPAFYKYLIDRDMEDLEETYQKMIELAAHYGYTAVDCSMEVSFLGLEKVKRILEKNNMAVGCFMYSEAFDNPDEATAPERVEKAPKATDMAKALGASVLMLIPRGEDCLSGMTKETIHERLIRY